MKIAIIGAGAMGCLFGAYLSTHHEVTLIDVYPPQIEAINRTGVTVKEADEEVCYPGVKAVPIGCKLPVQDVLIVFVKNTQTEQALMQTKELIDEHSLVLTLQNGAGNDKVLSKFLPDGQIVVGTTKHNSINLGGGKVHHGSSGTTYVGSLTGNEAAAQKIAELFNGCGIETETSDDINRMIWAKLFINLSVNTITSLMNAPICFMKDESAWNAAKMLVHEAIGVAAADGYRFDEEEILNTIMDTVVNDHGGCTSMCQDRRRKIKTEVDHINGFIVEKGKSYDIPTPYSEMMISLIHAMEATYEF